MWVPGMKSRTKAPNLIFHEFGKDFFKEALCMGVDILLIISFLRDSCILDYFQLFQILSSADVARISKFKVKLKKPGSSASGQSFSVFMSACKWLVS